MKSIVSGYLGVVIALFLSPAVAHSETAGQPLTLEDAIHTALAHNQTVRVVDYGRQISRANLLAAWGQFDPAINFHDTNSENAAPNVGQPFVPQNAKEQDTGLSLDGILPWGMSYSVGAIAQKFRGLPGFYFNDSAISGDSITLTQPLLRGAGFGANLYNVRIAKANRAMSDATYRQGVIDLVTNVIINYNNLIQSKEGLRIAIFYRDNTATLLSENEKRFRVGSLAEVEVIQVRAQLATAEEQVIVAQRAVRDSENQLLRTMGETHFAVDGPPLQIAPLPDPTPLIANPDVDFKEALKRRPDYENARQGIFKLRASQSLAYNQLLPRLDLVASAGYNGLDQNYRASFDQVKADENRLRSIGVIVSIPLTFAQGRGNVRAARLGVRQAEENLRSLEADIALEITTYAGQLETTRARVESLKNAYTYTDETVQGEIKRLKAGTGDTFFVLQKQQDLAQVQSAQISAVSDERRAIANYQHSLATTLEANHIKIE